MVLPLSPWTGRPEEPPDFFVAPRANSRKASDMWPHAQVHTVKVSFQNADAPVAWAARRHGCDLLRNYTRPEVLHGIVASGDATCHLLELSCTPQYHNLAQLCKLVDEEGLGGGETVLSAELELVLPKPVLMPSGIAHVAACLHRLGACGGAGLWNLDQLSGELMLEGHSARVKPLALLSKLAELKPEDLGLLEHIHTHISQRPDRVGSAPTSELFKWGSAVGLEKALAVPVWQMPAPPPARLVSALANLSRDMPERLLDGAVQAGLGAWRPTSKDAQELQGLFAAVHFVHWDLTDATQVEGAATALELAPNIRQVTMACSHCPADDRQPSRTAWKRFFAALEHLELDFVLFADLKLRDPLLVPLLASTVGKVNLQEFQAHRLALSSSIAEALGRVAKQRTIAYIDGEPQAATALVRGLLAQPHLELKSLDLQGNRLGDELGQQVVQGLNKLQGLKKVCLQNGNDFSPNGWEQIKKLCGSKCIETES